MIVREVVWEIEAVGVNLRLEGDNVRIWFPGPEQKEKLADKIAFLRSHRTEVSDFLQARHAAPSMPGGVRLIEWKLKEPPVAVETCAVVIDTTLFAKSTLEQLRIALAQPKRWVGWSVPQLVDRLAQVGVVVTLETISNV